MKSFANPNASRLVLPTVAYYPHDPIDGEILIIRTDNKKGIRWYDGDVEQWVSLYSTKNNIWECQVAEAKQYIFELENDYITDGNSIVVYLDGVRVDPLQIVEIDKNTVMLKEFYDEKDQPVYIQEGQLLSFQLFNLPI